MQRKQFDSINVVPFIDIMLVLLVIVLTTATFIQTGLIKLDLPKSHSKIEEKPKKELRISIDREGKIYLDKEQSSKEHVERVLQTYDRNTTIQLYCDKEAKYDNFVFLLDILKKNNFNHLGIVTKNE
ncbi:MAG TPA: biopolymer transporter ExbD [Epsilonproteobacteria bacterium]|nr:biopolymer transporter ExbD [Campylobacterota bacterium]HHH37132.1 biopolymer transporter ExbD [Campylobacterota bacterium]